ncbi:hypothetical protein [Homoserinimonas hongtaonis]|uniref:hypothetical protein n=1 Tax=Homoserinimonas hongtaonis TaxID=2079791 RepID=UPI00131EE9D6|nr:hypothetical protein [Salinibacterium hongtaonis]
MSSISVRRPAIAAIGAFAAITLAACSSGSGTTPEKSTDDSIVTGFYKGQEFKIGEPTTGGELRVGATEPRSTPPRSSRTSRTWPARARRRFKRRMLAPSIRWQPPMHRPSYSPSRRPTANSP